MTCVARMLLVAALALPAFAHEGLHERIAAMTQRIAADPQNASLYLERGELHRLHKDWKHAAADYDRAAKLDPSNVVVEYARGLMLLDASRFAESKQHLDRFLATRSDHAQAHLARARALVGLKRSGDAIADYDAAITLDPNVSPDLYFERAKLLASVGRTDDALRGLDAGIARLGNIVTLQSLAIEIAIDAKRYDDARARIAALPAGLQNASSIRELSARLSR